MSILITLELIIALLLFTPVESEVEVVESFWASHEGLRDGK